MGTGSFPGVNRQGSGVNHPPPSSGEVKVRVEVYTSPSAFMACYMVNFTFTFTFKFDSTAYFVT
jgi:hypothetical protein